MTEVVRQSAHAKINPYLRVLGKRRDGYHEIETLILPISLADHVAVSPRDEGFGLRVGGPLPHRVPPGEENLALRAARALAEAAGERRGANILIEKHIPVAAGLGGGSADASAVLRALNRLWGLGLGVERLAEIGAGVGSDVPAMVHARPVIARGRGEQIEPVDLPRTHWTLIVPDVPVSAGDAYGWLTRPRLLRRAPSLQLLLDALLEDIEQAGPFLHNDLARGARRHHEVIADAERDLLRGGPGYKAFLMEAGSRRGAIGAVMSGSGPTVAGLWANRKEARVFADFLRATHVETLAPTSSLSVSVPPGTVRP